jgi:hypothetical protein
MERLQVPRLLPTQDMVQGMEQVCATRSGAVLGVPACPALSPAGQALLLLLLHPAAATAAPPLQHASVSGLQATAKETRARQTKDWQVVNDSELIGMNTTLPVNNRAGLTLSLQGWWHAVRH